MKGCVCWSGFQPFNRDVAWLSVSVSVSVSLSFLNIHLYNYHNSRNSDNNNNNSSTNTSSSNNNNNNNNNNHNHNDRNRNHRNTNNNRKQQGYKWQGLLWCSPRRWSKSVLRFFGGRWISMPGDDETYSNLQPLLLMVQKSQGQPPDMYENPGVMGINYQPQLVIIHQVFTFNLTISSSTYRPSNHPKTINKK